MPVVGSPEWLEELLGAGEAVEATPGLDMALQFEVSASVSSRSKKNVTRFWVELADGRPVAAGEGKHADAQCAVACAFDDGLALLTGGLDPDVAFMQGRFKLDGAYEPLLFDGRHVFARADHVALRARVAGFSEPPAG